MVPVLAPISGRRVVGIRHGQRILSESQERPTIGLGDVNADCGQSCSLLADRSCGAVFFEWSAAGFRTLLVNHLLQMKQSFVGVAVKYS